MKAILIALGVGLGGALAGFLLYRRVSWRLEVPMSEQRRKAFEGMAPRYRQTYAKQWWKLNIRRDRHRRRA